MSEQNVKLLRVESVLKELISEALGQMRDEKLLGLNIIDVKVSKGKNDAVVFIFDDDFADTQKRQIMAALKKCAPIIANYCLTAEGWYKMPKLKFEFDSTMSEIKSLENIFKEIGSKK
ncbi:MAG: ribosome-binding factor RbfA [Pseudomonadota bacterium]|jgi:ribosome-binding factor A